MQTKLSIFCDKVIEAGWLAAAIVTPLFFNVYSNRVFEPDKLTLLRSIALVMAVAWIIKMLEAGSWKLEAGSQQPATSDQQSASSFQPSALRIPLVLPTLLLAAVYILTTITSVTPRTSLWGSYQRLQGTYTTLSYMVVFLLTLQTLRTREQLDRLITVMMLVSLPIGLYGIVQHYGLDPLPWASPVHRRVASAMGNSIFVAAYLIMVVPLTMGRLIESLSALLREEESALSHFILAACYIFILAVQLICIVFTQSRGPFLGLLGGAFFFLLLFALVRRVRWLALTAIGAAIAIIAFLIVFNLPQSPLAPLKDLPYLGRLGRVMETQTGTGRVRVLIWQGAVDMIAASPLRAIIGYGPESMFVAYNPYYPPELAHVEARGASPDRSHNETFDALVITGFIGFVVYLFLFGSLFYHGLKWLGFIANPQQRTLFVALWLAGGALGGLLPRLIEGSFIFAGVGIPLGIMAGLSLYISIFTLFIQGRQGSNSEPGPGTRDYLLLIALLSAIVAHFIEIHFGIAIAATRTYFWLYAALLVVVGFFLARGRLQAPKPSSRRRRRRRRRPTRLSAWFSPPLVTYSLLGGLILTTMVYDFVIMEKPYGLLWLILLIWLFSGVVFVAQMGKASSRRGGAWWLRSLASYLLVSGVCLALFWFIHYSRLPPKAEPRNIITVYYLWLFASAALMALSMMRGRTLPRTLWRKTNLLLYPVLIAGVALLIFFTNINVVRADIVFKQGLFYEGKDWNQSVGLYHIALQLAPSQDYYLLFLGRAYVEMANAAPDASQRDALFEEARKVLERARELNPLNTDHTANLARMYRSWGEATDDPMERAEKLDKALEYYRKATILSPNNAQLFNEWGSLHHFRGEYGEAIGKYQRSLTLDKEYIDTYLLLGDAYRAMENLEGAAEAYRRAIELDPKAPQAHSLLGLVYAQQGKLEEAVLENLAVIEISPNDYPSHKNLALLYRDLGRIEEALAEARIALKLAPEEERAKLEEFIAKLSPDEELIQSYLSQGQAYLDKKELDKAAEAYTKALALDPNLVQAHSALGYIYAQQGRLQEAVEENLKVLELAPRDYASHKNLAILYQQLGRIDEAIAEAKTALELAPEGDKPALKDFIAQLETRGLPESEEHKTP